MMGDIEPAEKVYCCDCLYSIPSYNHESKIGFHGVRKPCCVLTQERKGAWGDEFYKSCEIMNPNNRCKHFEKSRSSWAALVVPALALLAVALYCLTGCTEPAPTPTVYDFTVLEGAKVKVEHEDGSRGVLQLFEGSRIRVEHFRVRPGMKMTYIHEGRGSE